MTETRHRICPFCEATCGLALTVRGREVLDVAGDEADIFSRGHLCPKGVAIRELDADPNRLRRPLLRRGGELVEATWDEAFAFVAERLPAIQAEHGRDAVGVFIGNASAHSLALSLYNGAFAGALHTKNFFSAGTTDQQPKQVSAACMFGTAVSVPIPDVDHTQLLWVLGANPLASNGSLMTAPGIGRRLRAIQERGGRVVVFDPRRSETAAHLRRARRAPTRAATRTCCWPLRTCCSRRAASRSAASPRTWPVSKRSPRRSGISGRSGLRHAAVFQRPRSAGSRASCRLRPRRRSTGASARARRSSACSRASRWTC